MFVTSDPDTGLPMMVEAHQEQNGEVISVVLTRMRGAIGRVREGKMASEPQPIMTRTFRAMLGGGEFPFEAELN